MIKRIPRLVGKEADCYKNAILIIFIISTLVSAQERRLVVDTFHSVSLEGNLLWDSSERNVIVYLPPSYDDDVGKRYPVVYLLHGNSARYAGTFNPNGNWIEGHYQGMNIKTSMDSLIIDAGVVWEMILVMPNGRNRYRGSHYVNSSVTGKWADYIANDLVEHIDSTYRTIPLPQCRGIAGHSMGANGTLYLGMTNPDVFGAIYCMSGGLNFSYLPDQHNDDPEWWMKLLQLQDINQAELRMVSIIGLSAAFSPNPDRPPFFVDFPYELIDDTLRPLPEIWKKWQAFNLVNLVSFQQVNLLRLRAIRFDCGTSDSNIVANRALAEALSAEGITYGYEEYEGTHGNRIRNRMETKVLPFFSEVLAFTNSTSLNEKD
jgi:enterochelin esterase-like enzyme